MQNTLTRFLILLKAAKYEFLIFTPRSELNKAVSHYLPCNEAGIKWGVDVVAE